MEKRILVSFGRSDPLRLTEATHEVLGDGPTYVWGPDFGRPVPGWALDVYGSQSHFDGLLKESDTVYCGHGATLLEATAAGCEVMVLAGGDFRYDPPNRLEFIPAWSGPHLDHSGRRVAWWEPGVMAAMHRELVERRRGDK